MKFISGIAWMLILIIRGFALLILVPVAFFAWGLIHWWAQQASPGQAVAWYDFNFVALLANGPFRLFIPAKASPNFAAISLMGKGVSHKVTWNDIN